MFNYIVRTFSLFLALLIIAQPIYASAEAVEDDPKVQAAKSMLEDKVERVTKLSLIKGLDDTPKAWVTNNLKSILECSLTENQFNALLVAYDLSMDGVFEPIPEFKEIGRYNYVNQSPSDFFFNNEGAISAFGQLAGLQRFVELNEDNTLNRSEKIRGAQLHLQQLMNENDDSPASGLALAIARHFTIDSLIRNTLKILMDAQRTIAEIDKNTIDRPSMSPLAWYCTCALGVSEEAAKYMQVKLIRFYVGTVKSQFAGFDKQMLRKIKVFKAKDIEDIFENVCLNAAEVLEVAAEAEGISEDRRRAHLESRAIILSHSLLRSTPIAGRWWDSAKVSIASPPELIHTHLARAIEVHDLLTDTRDQYMNLGIISNILPLYREKRLALSVEDITRIIEYTIRPKNDIGLLITFLIHYERVISETNTEESIPLYRSIFDAIKNLTPSMIMELSEHGKNYHDHDKGRRRTGSDLHDENDFMRYYAHFSNLFKDLAHYFGEIDLLNNFINAEIDLFKATDDDSSSKNKRKRMTRKELVAKIKKDQAAAEEAEKAAEERRTQMSAIRESIVRPDPVAVSIAAPAGAWEEGETAPVHRVKRARVDPVEDFTDTGGAGPADLPAPTEVQIVIPEGLTPAQIESLAKFIPEIEDKPFVSAPSWSETTADFGDLLRAVEALGGTVNNRTGGSHFAARMENIQIVLAQNTMNFNIVSVPTMAIDAADARTSVARSIGTATVATHTQGALKFCQVRDCRLMLLAYLRELYLASQ